MKKISNVLNNDKSIIAYLMVGDPTMELSEEIIDKILPHIDVLELGVPFSDPIADGPTIQKAASRALEAKANISKMMGLVKKVRGKGINTPIITMLYYNLVMQYGLEKFVNDLKKNGINGALIPDLPLEESEAIRELFHKNDLDFPMLITPVTNIDRAKNIAEATSGFLYYVSYTGTTGSKQTIDFSFIKKNIKALKTVTNVPIAVGFGIKSSEDVDKICSFADAAIIGSAIIKIIEENLGKKDLVDKVVNFVKQLKEGK